VALLRAPEPDPAALSAPIPGAGDGLQQVLASPEPPRLDARRSRPIPAESTGEPTAVTLDVLSLPAGGSLRRECTECPGVQILLARYPELGSKEAAQSIRAAAAGSRSGLIPHRADTGCYAVVVITANDGAAQVDTVTSGADHPPPGGTADATARRMLAAHIDDMAKRKSAEVPVIPVKGQLPFPLPGQLPDPAPSTTNPDRPVADPHRHGTAA